MVELLQETYSSSDLQAKNRIITILANVLGNKISQDEQIAISSLIREALHGKHFDRASAKARISQIYYISEEGVVKYAPFISEAKSCELYEEYRNHIVDYNVHDFAVVLNNMIANYHNLLHAWWYSEDAVFLLAKYCELAVNWLNDDDTQWHGEKAWVLLSGEK